MERVSGLKLGGLRLEFRIAPDGWSWAQIKQCLRPIVEEIVDGTSAVPVSRKAILSTCRLALRAAEDWRCHFISSLFLRTSSGAFVQSGQRDAAFLDLQTTPAFFRMRLVEAAKGSPKPVSVGFCDGCQAAPCGLLRVLLRDFFSAAKISGATPSAGPQWQLATHA